MPKLLGLPKQAVLRVVIAACLSPISDPSPELLITDVRGSSRPSINHVLLKLEYHEARLLPEKEPSRSVLNELPGVTTEDIISTVQAETPTDLDPVVIGGFAFWQHRRHDHTAAGNYFAPLSVVECLRQRYARGSITDWIQEEGKRAEVSRAIAMGYIARMLALELPSELEQISSKPYVAA